MGLRLVAVAAVLAAVAVPSIAVARAPGAGRHLCQKRTRCAVLHHRQRPAPRRALERLLGVGPGPTSAPDPGSLPGPGVPQGPGAPVAPRFVSVAAREYSLTLSRPLVGTGGVSVELRNSGEDPHNLVVSPEGTHSPLAAFSDLDPGTYERRVVTLAPGRYQLWCSLEGHEGLGMSTTLRVQ